MNMEPIDRKEMALLVDEISSMTPVTGEDYSMGYHTALMYIKRYLMGKNPFEITCNGLTISIERQQ